MLKCFTLADRICRERCDYKSVLNYFFLQRHILQTFPSSYTTFNEVRTSRLADICFYAGKKGVLLGGRDWTLKSRCKNLIAGTACIPPRSFLHFSRKRWTKIKNNNKKVKLNSRLAAPLCVMLLLFTESFQFHIICTTLAGLCNVGYAERLFRVYCMRNISVFKGFSRLRSSAWRVVCGATRVINVCLPAQLCCCVPVIWLVVWSLCCVYRVL